MDSKGYCFQIDLTWRGEQQVRRHRRCRLLTERELCVSKMTGPTFVSAGGVARWGTSRDAFRARTTRTEQNIARPGAEFQVSRAVTNEKLEALTK